jgi:hypothetical protein
MKDFFGVVAVVVLVAGLFLGIVWIAERSTVREQSRDCAIVQSYIQQAYWQDDGSSNFGCYIDLNENLRVNIGYVEGK